MTFLTVWYCILVWSYSCTFKIDILFIFNSCNIVPAKMLKPWPALHKTTNQSFPNKYKGVYICYVSRYMLYTTDISMNKINTKKKLTLLKKSLMQGLSNIMKKKKTLIQFSLYKSTIKLINFISEFNLAFNEAGSI